MGSHSSGQRPSSEISLGAYDESESPWNPTPHQYLVMIPLAVISFMVALDACIIVTSLNAILSDLQCDTTQGIWIGTAYLLSSALVMPFLSEISDTFGRPVILVASLASFALGTVLCCLSHAVTLILTGRAFQGIGGGGILVLSLAIFTDRVPLRHRPKWYGIVLGAWALGNCIGPVLGGVIVQNTTWRWIFYIMFPFNAFGLLIVPGLMALPRRPSIQRTEGFDALGGVSFSLSVTLFLIAISWGGSRFDWSSAGTMAPLCLGSIGLLCTMYYESEIAKHPFFRSSLFRSASSLATYLCGAIQGLVIYGQLYYIPFYFLSVKKYSPISTGIALLPMMVTMAPSSVVSGIVVTRTNDYRWPIWLGWVAITVGSVLTELFDADTPVPVWTTVLGLLGLGHGAVLNAQSFATQAMCRLGEESRAAAMYAFLRQLGMALGVATGGTMFQNALGRHDLPSAFAGTSEASASYLSELRGDLKEQSLDAYVFGFRAVYLLHVVMSGVALLLSLLLKRFDMNKALRSTDQLEGNALVAR